MVCMVAVSSTAVIHQPRFGPDSDKKLLVSSGIDLTASSREPTDRGDIAAGGMRIALWAFWLAVGSAVFKINSTLAFLPRNGVLRCLVPVAVDANWLVYPEFADGYNWNIRAEITPSKAWRYCAFKNQHKSVWTLGDCHAAGTVGRQHIGNI